MISIREVPIVFFDTETEVSNDLPVEISACLAIGKEVKECFTTLVDIGTPITAKSTMIHGISDDMLREQRAPMLAVALRCFRMWLDSVGAINVAAYNSPFDTRIIQGAVKRSAPDLGDFFKDRLVFDVLVLARKLIKATDNESLWAQPDHAPNRKLQTLRQKFCPRLEGAAHRGEADVKSTVHVFHALLDLYETKVGADLLDPHHVNTWLGIFEPLETFTFGKHNGKSVAAVWKMDPGYCNYMLGQKTIDPEIRAGLLKFKPR